MGVHTGRRCRLGRIHLLASSHSRRGRTRLTLAQAALECSRLGLFFKSSPSFRKSGMGFCHRAVQSTSLRLPKCPLCSSSPSFLAVGENCIKVSHKNFLFYLNQHRQQCSVRNQKFVPQMNHLHSQNSSKIIISFLYSCS